MPVTSDAEIEISAFTWVPPFAVGLVRDLRVRWALEEAGLDYRERLLDAETKRDPAYLREQPFSQVPTYRRGEVRMFESGAIVLHIAEGCDALMPEDAPGRARVQSWVFAALNSIEPAIAELTDIDLFHREREWSRERRPEAERRVLKRLCLLSDWLGGSEYLEGRFSAADLMMTSVLRILRHTDLVSRLPNLHQYQARCEARPAFSRALEAQLAAFSNNQPAEAQ